MYSEPSTQLLELFQELLWSFCFLKPPRTCCRLSIEQKACSEVTDNIASLMKYNTLRASNNSTVLAAVMTSVLCIAPPRASTRYCMRRVDQHYVRSTPGVSHKTHAAISHQAFPKFPVAVVSIIVAAFELHCFLGTRLGHSVLCAVVFAEPSVRPVGIGAFFYLSPYPAINALVSFVYILKSIMNIYIIYIYIICRQHNFSSLWPSFS